MLTPVHCDYIVYFQPLYTDKLELAFEQKPILWMALIGNGPRERPTITLPLSKVLDMNRQKTKRAKELLMQIEASPRKTRDPTLVVTRF
jgi:hypothetical protein